MKNLAIILVLLFGLSTVVMAQKAENKVVCFKSSMDCESCEKTLTENLKFEKGVKDLKIDHVSNTILIEYKEGKNNDAELAKAIEKKGYKAEKISKEQYGEIVAKSVKSDNQHSK